MSRRAPPLPISAELNLTNLIDVVFTLLIIFMITAPLLTQGIKVELPKLKAGSLETQNTISIHILQSREIFVEVKGIKRKVPLTDFETAFRQIYRNYRLPVILNADKRIPYGIVMQVIGRLTDVGVEQLGFLTDPVESNDALQSLKL